MTRYYVDISTELVTVIKKKESRLPDGFRLIERWGPRFGDMERWIVEDDYAGEEFEDYLVMLSFSVNENGLVKVTRREIQQQRY